MIAARQVSVPDSQLPGNWFQLAIGPAGEVFREAGDLAEQRRDEIVSALKRELARYETSEGIVLESSSWMASARNPD